MTGLETVEDTDLEKEESSLLLGRLIDDEHSSVHWRLDHAMSEGGPPTQEVRVVIGIARFTDD